MAFKKRRDGVYLKHLPAFRRIFPYLMPTRDVSILLLTHGNLIRELLNLLLDCRHTVRFSHDNTGITCISRNGCWRLHYANRLS